MLISSRLTQSTFPVVWTLKNEANLTLEILIKLFLRLLTFASGSLLALLDSSSTAGRFLKEEKSKLHYKQWPVSNFTNSVLVQHELWIQFNSVPTLPQSTEAFPEQENQLPVLSDLIRLQYWFKIRLIGQTTPKQRLMAGMSLKWQWIWNICMLAKSSVCLFSDPLRVCVHFTLAWATHSEVWRPQTPSDWGPGSLWLPVGPGVHGWSHQNVFLKQNN